MKPLDLALLCTIALQVACTRGDHWEAKPGSPAALKKVYLEMAINPGTAFEENVHALAVYAFLETGAGNYAYYRQVANLTREDIKTLEAGGSFGTGQSKLLKLTLPEGTHEFFCVANDLTGQLLPPLPGGSPPGGYLPYPPGGEIPDYFMTRAVQKPGVSGDIPIYMVLDRVVSRLSVIVRDIPPGIDTVRYRVNGIASRVLLTGLPAGPTLSVEGTYTRDRVNTANDTDTIISRLSLFPALGATADLRLSFYTRSLLVREKHVTLDGLAPDGDVHVTGKWDRGER